MASGLESSDLWRQIPPEEKFDIMARAHACGITWAVVTIIVASTMAIGLQLNWMLWASFVTAPMIFQFAAGKAWRDIKPCIMLEYLAARSAARRYAYTSKAESLDIELIFRGRIERLFDQENIQEALDAKIENRTESEVWIVLFNDAVVMMSEQPGGAVAEFAHLVNDRMILEASALDGKGDTSDNLTRMFVNYANQPGNDPVALAAIMRRRGARFRPEELAALTVPTLVVIGDRDFAGPGDPLVEALPDARHTVLRNTDHFATPESFGFIDAALEFLGAVPA